MPELAEVEFFRKQWNCGLGQKIVAVKLHLGKRVFRGANERQLAALLRGATLISSAARGKQMLFQFSHRLWLGLHLGMTGKLQAAPADYEPAKHDHLVLCQKKCALIFNDLRQFGRIVLHQGIRPPAWWQGLPVDLLSRQFTAASTEQFLQRHRRLPIKAALLLQNGFPGIGNWMADEVLWRAKVHPRTPAGRIQGPAAERLWREIRSVCRQAMKTVGQNYSDPPVGWLFHQRWERGGMCPVHRNPLRKETIGGRTTAWCPKCQRRRE